MAQSTDFSLAAMYQAQASAIFGYVLMRCGSRSLAEDITAQTFLDASRHDASGKGWEVSPGWLRVVARRRLIDHWRASSRHDRRIEALTTQMRSQRAPEDDLDDRVQQALNSLSTPQRAALTLRYLEDFSVSEIAESLNLSYKAAESLLSRSRAAFAAAYEAVDTDG